MSIRGLTERARAVASSVAATPTTPITPLRACTLRSYQEVGVNWSVRMFKNGCGCINADEMGLGKTIQALAHMHHLYMHGLARRFLVVCPLSVLDNWRTEFEKTAPSLRPIIYAGSKGEREEIAEQIETAAPDDDLTVLTTYELCLSESDVFAATRWHVLVLDEAQRIKNAQSKTHGVLGQLHASQRLLLSGTPVQNNLAELYALLAFANPHTFKREEADDFIEYFGCIAGPQSNGSSTEPLQQKRTEELHELLRTFLLRRTKEEVASDIPSKSQVVLYAPMSALQLSLYKTILTNDIEAFSASTSSKGRLVNILAQLRKCANHPYLFDGVEPEPFQLGDHLIDASGKLRALDLLLPFLSDGGHKVLIFSQMTRMLDIVQDYLHYRDYTYERLDGSVRGEERFLAIRNFKERDTFVFLLSTKAGGVGLNLTAADTVVFLDADFNPQNDLQAAARVHRLGQTRPVRVIQLVSRHTVDEVILKRANQKLALTSRVMVGAQSDEADVAPGPDQLPALLRYGLDQLFNEKDSDGPLYTRDTLEELLGPSVDGKWGEVVKETQAEDEGEEAEDIYDYQGVSYRNRQAVLDQLLEQKRNELPAPPTATDTLGARTRTKATISTSDLQQMAAQEQALAAAREAERRAKREKRQQQETERRQQHWQATGYVSAALPPADQSQQPKLSTDDDTDHLHHVHGDVTHPQGSGHRVVVHAVSTGGVWGSGGLFGALDRVCQDAKVQYELAGSMDHLHVGDVHVVSMATGQHPITVALIVVHKVTVQTNQIKPLDAIALAECLRKLAHYCKTHNATLHLPRLGSGPYGPGWYAIERLVRRYVAETGIDTYVYYFQRRTQPPPPTVSSDDDIQPIKRQKKRSPSPQQRTMPKKPRPPPTSAIQRQFGALVPLPDTFGGLVVHFAFVPADVLPSLQRHLIAFGGAESEEVGEDTTHVIVGVEEVEAVRATYPDVEVRPWVWLQRCLDEGRIVD